MLQPNVTVSLRDLFISMEHKSVIAPMVFLTVFHLAFPRFAEKSADGNLIQHDAAECWTSLMRSLQQDLKTADNQGTGDNISAAQAIKSDNFIEQYFEGKFSVTMKNTGNHYFSIIFSIIITCKLTIYHFCYFSLIQKMKKKKKLKL